jgi:hypothetical protein
MSENFERFQKQPNPENQGETQKQPENEITPGEVEMPENFVEPEGESGRWKTEKGEVEIEGKKVEVAYREKVIELPKHRQEETGIQRIRRRELLPPFPEGLYDTSGKDIDSSGHSQPQASKVWSSRDKFDNFYKLFTDNEYPSEGTLVHHLEWTNWYQHGTNYGIHKHLKEGLYFQKVNNENRNFYFAPIRKWGSTGTGYGKFNTPFFVFGNKNTRIIEYIDFILELEGKEIKKWNRYFNTGDIKEGEWDTGYGNPDFSEQDYDILKKIKNRETVSTFDDDEVKTSLFGNPAIRMKKPLRWCHAELAIIPTKRSLNVLFFETGDEDKVKEKK